ncbi:MAG: hypothetical protein PUB18_04535 [bacterium]|nr:hypothetical protein [bacterium]
MNNNMDQNYMQGQGFGFPFPGQNINQQLRNLENRVSTLEREVNRLRNRVSRIENSIVIPLPRDENNYTDSYQKQGYHMM